MGRVRPRTRRIADSGGVWIHPSRPIDQKAGPSLVRSYPNIATGDRELKYRQGIRR